MDITFPALPAGYRTTGIIHLTDRYYRRLLALFWFGCQFPASLRPDVAAHRFPDKKLISMPGIWCAPEMTPPYKKSGRVYDESQTIRPFLHVITVAAADGLRQ
jgi:hypothetical protein